MNKYIIGTIVFIVLVYLHILYWRSTLSSNEKFKSLLSIWVSTSLFISLYSVYLQTNGYRESQIQIETNSFNSLFNSFFDSVVQLFISNTQMNYYYNELFTGISNYKDSDRNLVLEHEVSVIIFSKMENIINFVDIFSINPNIVGQTEQKLLKILKVFFKSKIFLENWKIYKNSFATDWTIQYIDAKFNL